MKKIFILFSAASFIISCGNNNSDPNNNSGEAGTAGTTAPVDTANTTQQASNADADKGLDLIAQSDCLTCHKVEDKLVGPSYREVANRYANEPAIVDSLASKIIKGGAGNWGQVPMTPHPALAQADAQLMVKYILSLKQ